MFCCLPKAQCFYAHFLQLYYSPFAYWILEPLKRVCMLVGDSIFGSHDFVSDLGLEEIVHSPLKLVWIIGKKVVYINQYRSAIGPQIQLSTIPFTSCIEGPWRGESHSIGNYSTSWDHMPVYPPSTCDSRSSNNSKCDKLALSSF